MYAASNLHTTHLYTHSRMHRKAVQANRAFILMYMYTCRMLYRYQDEMIIRLSNSFIVFWPISFSVFYSIYVFLPILASTSPSHLFQESTPYQNLSSVIDQTISCYTSHLISPIPGLIINQQFQKNLWGKSSAPTL